MKNYLLNMLLAILMAVALLAFLILKTLAPAVILLEMNVPNLAFVSLAVLVLEHYLAPDAKRCYFCVAGFAALTFGLLPFAAGFATGLEALKLALVGGAMFAVLTLVYSSAMDRISTGAKAKAAPVVTALGLFLAVQVFSGILL